MGDNFELTATSQDRPGRKEFDYYPTPAWVTQLLLRHYPPITRWLVEPAAGDGAICRELNREGEHMVWGIEIQEKFRDDLDRCCDQFSIADFFKMAPHISNILNDNEFSIVANPPFSLALEFIKACMNIGAKYIAMLLRIDFLGSKKRAAFHNANPLTQLLVLGQRPSFTGKGTDSYNYAWFVYDKDKAPRAPIVI